MADKPLTYESRIAALSAGTAALGLTEPRPLKLTVDDLVLLDRHWQDDDHKSTELIDGRIYFTPARYMPRGQIVQEIWLQLREAAAVVAPHLYVGMRGSIEVSSYDLPLPDVVLTHEAHGSDFISAASVSLVVEVAEARLGFYLDEKMRLYAHAEIPEYWVVDVCGQVIQQMHKPAANGFTKKNIVKFGQRLDVLTASGLSVETNTFCGDVHSKR